MNAAAAGVKTRLGAWTGRGTLAAGAGTDAGYFRILDSAYTAAHIQGTVTVTGGGGNLTVDNNSIANNQLVDISTFTVTALNA
jgi:hypothetical protein